MNTVEIIAENKLDAINAQKGGAKRIEIVSALSEGGLTPSLGMVKEILENTVITTAVMIRPTSKSFCYDKHYLDVIKRDIQIIDSLEGNKKIVLGILDKQNNIDLEAMDYVLENINTPVTFHRAIDSSNDLLKSIDILNNYDKVDLILTSGSNGKATDHLPIIKEMILKSKKKIMIGSGMTLDAVDQVKNYMKDITNYDIHFGSFVKGKDQIVDETIVRKIVDKFNQK